MDIKDRFGKQAVVGSIDVKKTKNEYFVFDYLKNENLPLRPQNYVKKLEDFGVGEILLNSVDRDGSKTGFDLSLIQMISKVIKIPMICIGGAGSPNHFKEVFKLDNIWAVGASNFFHFTEHSVTITKAILKDFVKIRQATEFDYSKHSFDETGRLKKII